MFALIPLWLRALALLALVAAVWGHGAYTGYSHAHGQTVALQAQFDTFRAETAALGKVAEANRIAVETADNARKAKADNENRSTIAVLRADNKRLRDERASSSFLPQASPTARSPDSITFDRRLLEQALQRLDEGVSGLVGAGDEARVNLDTAKTWAQRALNEAVR